MKQSDKDKIANRLVTMFWLYPHYRVDSRGPAGCIIDILDLVSPDIAKEFREGIDAHDIYKKHWGD